MCVQEVFFSAGVCAFQEVLSVSPIVLEAKAKHASRRPSLGLRVRVKGSGFVSHPSFWKQRPKRPAGGSRQNRVRDRTGGWRLPRES